MAICENWSRLMPRISNIFVETSFVPLIGVRQSGQDIVAPALPSVKPVPRFLGCMYSIQRVMV